MDFKNKLFFILIIIILVLTLLLSYNVFSIDESLFESKSLILESNINGFFKSSYNYNSKFSYLKFNFSSYPKKSYYVVLKQNFNPTPKINDNDYVLFEWNNLKDRYDFNIYTKFYNTYIDSNVKKKMTYYEYKKSLPKNLEVYTKPTKLIDSDNENIKILASKLVEGSKDFFDLEKKLIEYVNGNVEYNLSTINVEGSFSASQVLERKEGVCDEITILFIALNRALGIPARYVSGYSFSDLFKNEGSWLGHAWVEVYYDGEWIPFDLTYQEYLHLDPLHVAFKKTAIPNREDNNYEWRGYNVKIDLSKVNYDFNILEKNEKIVFGTIKSKVLKENIGEDSYNVLEVTVKNNNDFTIMPVINIGNTKGLKFFNNKKIVVLYPFEERKVYFLFRLNSSLDYGYIYTFPIIVYSRGFENSQSDFKAEKNSFVYSKSDFEKYFENKVYYEENFDVNCNFKREYFYNKSEKVNCKVKNEGNKNYDFLTLCLDYNCKSFSLNINEEKNVVLNFKTKIGEENKILRLKDKNKVLYLKKVSFVSYKEANVTLNTTYKNNILNLNIKSDRRINGTIKILINNKLYKKYYFEGKENNVKIKIENNVFDSLDNNIKIIFEYNDLNTKKILEKNITVHLEKNLENYINVFFKKLVLFFNNIFNV